MTDSTEQNDLKAVGTTDGRSPEQVEIDRLKNECAVWRTRCEQSQKTYNKYREDAQAFDKKNQETISDLTAMCRKMEDHIREHHLADERHSIEMKRMKIKLDSYSSLLSLMADAGRLHPDLLDQIDAGISAMHDSKAGTPEVKFFVSENPMQDLLSFLAKNTPENDEDEDPESKGEYDEDEADDEPQYVSGPDMDKLSYTDVGLPKRPVKDAPTPGNDWADSDPEAPWNQ